MIFVKQIRPAGLLISIVGIALILAELFYFKTLFIEAPLHLFIILVLLIPSIRFEMIKQNKIIQTIHVLVLLGLAFCFFAYWAIMVFGAGFEGRDDDVIYLFLLALYVVVFVFFNIKINR